MTPDLMSALTGLQYSGKTDPFGIAAQALGGNIGNLSNPYGSAGTNAIATIGASLLAGLLAGVGQNRADTENAALKPLISQYISGTPEQRTALEAQEPRLASLGTTLGALNLQRAQELQQKRDEAQIANEAKLSLDTSEIPVEVRKAQALIGPEVAKQVALGTAEIPIEVRKAQALIGPEVAKQAALAPGAVTQAGAEEAAKVAAQNTGIGFNPKIEEAIKSKQQQFNTDPVVDRYSQVSRSANAFANAIQDKSGVADSEIARLAVQTLNPGKVVRDASGAVQAVEESEAIPSQWKGKLQKALTGQTVLDDQMRQALKDMVAREYTAAAEPYNTTLDFYRKEATTMGLDPNRIAPLGAATPIQNILPGISLTGMAAPAASPPRMITAPDGKIYKFVD